MPRDVTEILEDTNSYSIQRGQCWRSDDGLRLNTAAATHASSWANCLRRASLPAEVAAPWHHLVGQNVDHFHFLRSGRDWGCGGRGE